MKRLSVSMDGTWDDLDEATLTNVVKLHRRILPADAAGVRQVAHYEIGIATDGGRSGTARFLAGAIGVGVDTRIKNAYRFLAANYRPGDEIYLFGFSRGAFQARSLASLIALLGLPGEASGRAVEAAWAYYGQHKPRPRPRKLEALRAAGHYPVPIKCVGVWDTVGNLGLPLPKDAELNRKHRRHDMSLPTGVEVALHALAIDEQRGPFRPTLWTLPRGESPRPGQIVEQVWFPGGHSDVGGGLTASALSDIALNWMAERIAATTGLALDLGGLRAASRPDPLGEQYNPLTSGLFRVTNVMPYVRLIRQDRRAIPLARRMLLGTWRTGKAPAGEVPVNEQIHPSAIERWGKDVHERAGDKLRPMRYQPRNLKVVLPRS